MLNEMIHFLEKNGEMYNPYLKINTAVWGIVRYRVSTPFAVYDIVHIIGKTLLLLYPILEK